MGASHFLTRTLDKVRTEISLHVLAYNLKRMIAIKAPDSIDIIPAILGHASPRTGERYYNLAPASKHPAPITPRWINSRRSRQGNRGDFEQEAPCAP